LHITALIGSFFLRLTFLLTNSDVMQYLFILFLLLKSAFSSLKSITSNVI